MLYVQDHSSDFYHFTLSASGLRLTLGTVLTARLLVTALDLNPTIYRCETCLAIKSDCYFDLQLESVERWIVI